MPPNVPDENRVLLLGDLVDDQIGLSYISSKYFLKYLLITSLLSSIISKLFLDINVKCNALPEPK